MASRLKSIFVCSECGYEAPKWYGKCPGCGEWNTMEEEIRDTAPTTSKSSGSSSGSSLKPVRMREIDTAEEERYLTGMGELDRVLGGGIVKGSLVLISGDPGIGKSTILLQICEHLGRILKILYVTGEESRRQIKLRASRLGVDSDNLYVLANTDLRSILNTVETEKPDLLMVDSIQTMSLSDLSSSPGSVSQVRECTNAILHTAKTLDIPALVVGHVNKEGAIAGPKVLEHIVDAVLYFEGDKQHSYRILRAEKNRFGPTGEIGVFDMDDSGLKEVPNPSVMMLSGRPENVSGTAVTCVMEGSRPLLAEIQGLVTTTGFGNPRRMSTGFDYNRMALLIAVLEKRAGYFFSNLDAYVNIVGGLHIDEPAVDLAVSVALISSLKNKEIDSGTIVFGEIGLTGEIRTVTNSEKRISEAARLGFKRCILPYYNLKSIDVNKYPEIEIIGVKTVNQAFDAACKY